MAKAQKSTSWPTKLLNVASLDLDHKNPRLGALAASFSPKEIVQYLFQHDKAIEIADSIARRGYFPNEPVLAIREGRRYTVIEGNRRLAALMALREPTQLTDAAQRTIEKLSKKIPKENLIKIPVTIAPNRKATDKQVSGRHIGTPVLAWRAENRARFVLEKLNEGYTKEELLTELGFSASDIRSAKETRAIMELARAIDLPPEIKEKIDTPQTKTVSTLERLFESTVGRQIMHVARDEEHGYKVMTSRTEFIPFFQKLVRLAASGKVTTRTFNSNDETKDYFDEEWKAEDLPKKRSASFVPADLKKAEKPSETISKNAPKPKQRPLFKTVLPTSLKVVYGPERLRIIRDELTTLDREKKSNAGAVLLRVFFELCVVDYLKRSGRMATLEQKLTAKGIRWKYDYPAMDHLLKEIKEVAEKNLSRADSNKVKKALFGNRESVHSLNDLHAFVHDSADLPTEKDIMQFWLRTESLFRLMLEIDPATHK